MKTEGLTLRHAAWFAVWTYLLLAVITAPAPHQLNHAFAIETAQRLLRGLQGLERYTQNTAIALDEFSRQRWDKEEVEEEKEVKVCHETADGVERCGK